MSYYLCVYIVMRDYLYLKRAKETTNNYIFLHMVLF